MATILITGGNGGFGRACAVELTRLGHRVVATVRTERAAAELAEHCRVEGVSTDVVLLDVTDDRSVVDGVDAAVRRAGPVDVLVNNAGFFEPGAVELTPDDAARRMLETNLFGALRLIRAVLPSMRERGSGAILSVTSMLGHTPAPLAGVYAASKQALEAVTEALAVEVAPFGIRVGSVIPAGPYQTRIAEPRPAHEGRVTPYDDLERRLLERKRRRLTAGGDMGEVVQAVVRAAFGVPATIHVTTRPLPEGVLARSLAAADERVAALLEELGLGAT